MKVIVFSDTHHAVHPALDAVLECRPDAVIHLGDCVRDAEDIACAFPDLPLYNVAGNNDLAVNVPLCQVIELGGARLYLTHGHMENVRWGLSGLLMAARRAGAKAALFGHTHVACVKREQGVLVLNPGSANAMLAHGVPGYAILTIAQAGELSAEIVAL